MTTPNFVQLYAQLDLQPGCTLDELRHAYRQRMMQLHPDKQAAPAAHAAAASAAADLNYIYASAIRFHKEHGRLPGGRSPVTATDESGQEPEPAAQQSVNPEGFADSALDQSPTLRRGPRLLILFLLLALALAVFLDSASETASEPTAPFTPGK